MVAVLEKLPKPLAREEFLKEMVRRIDGKRHSDYPMVNLIRAGKATRQQIGYLGVLFYHFTKVTPQVLSTIHSRCDDRRIRRRIMDTLIDEDTELRCGSKGHDELALDFGTRFTGLSEDEVESFPVPQSIKDMVAYRFKVAREMPVTVALGNSGIASESHAPQMCRLISDGLREHYGVNDEDQESWIVHIDGDEDHSETAFKVVLDKVTTAEDQAKMLWCIDEYLFHWGNFWKECEKGRIILRK
ncbi:MAG TPA: iron-containing redox enzyme family protein [Alphaproteobacteria bacterium]